MERDPVRRAPVTARVADCFAAPFHAAGAGDLQGSPVTRPPPAMLSYFRCNACCVAEGRQEEKTVRPADPSVWFQLPEGLEGLDMCDERQPAGDPQGLGLEDRGAVELESGATYTGQWLGEHRHGQGIMVRTDGGKYDGQFQESRAYGAGRFTHANGDMYDGEWVSDKAHGRGKFLHADGSSYTGEWCQDMKAGQGSETWVDGWAMAYVGRHPPGTSHLQAAPAMAQRFLGLACGCALLGASTGLRLGGSAASAAEGDYDKILTWQISGVEAGAEVGVFWDGHKRSKDGCESDVEEDPVHYTSGICTMDMTTLNLGKREGHLSIKVAEDEALDEDAMLKLTLSTNSTKDPTVTATCLVCGDECELEFTGGAPLLVSTPPCPLTGPITLPFPLPDIEEATFEAVVMRGSGAVVGSISMNSTVVYAPWKHP